VDNLLADTSRLRSGKRDNALVHDTDHPDTLTSRNNLASALCLVGNLGRAILLYEHTLTDCDRVLGPDHPLTEQVRDSLSVLR